ncbi:MAG TPA: cytochrome d ubiquinol oxidase subunit II [Aquificales bacterium]|nr:cytochrome d ubiquinol oxidase subunit II [Aquificales bacterium]
MEALGYSPLWWDVLVPLWFVIVALVWVMYILTDGFDLGVGVLVPFMGKDDISRRIALNSVGPIWDGNEVWFITAGGAAYAAFPEIYAAIFGGLYLALMVILFALIFRAVGFEYRSKRPSPAWRSFWDWAISISSGIVALVLGVALGNIIVGLPFVKTTLVDPNSLEGFVYGVLDSNGQFHPYPAIIGFLQLLNPFFPNLAAGIFKLLVGITALLFVIMHGATWLMVKTLGEHFERSKSFVLKLWPITAILWVITTVWGFVSFGFTHTFHTNNPKVISETINIDFYHWGAVLDKVFTYHDNFLFQAPALVSIIGWILLGLGILGLLGVFFFARNGSAWGTFLSSSLAIIGILFAVSVALFPFTVPSIYGLENSMTVWNTAASENTLKVMTLAALIAVPIVLAYTAYIYKVFLFKLSPEQLKEAAEKGQFSY